MHKLFAAAIGATLAMATPLSAQDTADVTGDTVLAKVGGVDITMAHVIALRQQLPEQYQQLPDNVLFPGLLDQIVDQQLLANDAEASGELPTVTLKRLENERRAIVSRVAVDQIVGGGVTKDELRAAYDEQYVNADAEQEYNASHILVETQEDAAQVVADLEAGGDFAELAKERSTGPSGPGGGSLGWFTTERMVPEFSNAVAALEVGAISEPVETQFGWHVILLNEVRDVPPPAFEEVQGQLESSLLEGKITEHLTGLRNATEIEMLTDGVPLDAFRNDALLTE